MESGNHEHIVHVNRERGRHSFRDKPWKVSTVILLLLVILLILGSIFNITGKGISAKKAGDKLLTFATAQGLTAEVSSVEKQGNFYLVTLLIDGQDVPVYVTKDGKFFTSSLIPLEEQNDTSNTNTNTNTNTQTNIPKTAKPAVELFVMSYCPYGTQAEKGIIPAIEALGENIDFKLRFVYYAMHPTQGEVEENLRQYCIQKDQETKLLPYLKCFLQAGNSTSCLTEAKVDKTRLNTCVTATDKQFQITENKNDKTKWLSGNYPLFNIDKDLNTKYNVGGSPTLVINGVQVNSARDPASYLDSICKAFTDESVPTACGTKLSSTAYSAGFGYAAGSASGSGAQCG